MCWFGIMFVCTVKYINCNLTLGQVFYLKHAHANSAIPVHLLHLFSKR